MGLMDRLFHRETPPETSCPRCATPAPAGSVTCAACGWDLRESYHDARGADRDVVDAADDRR
jgi:hypothetical protein